tara:strand:- start:52 stop:513 length:462 start_codon:yes stop_codon:yes gene_type:complete
MRFKKNIISLILLLFFTNCGFTPIYKDGINLNTKIVFDKILGDRSMNNMIRSNLNRYSYEEADKIVQIDLNTIYEKNILAKDSTGKTTDYQIMIKAIFNITTENTNQEIIITETFDYKSFTKNFEELEYEQTVKQNMANLISKKLSNKLSKIK